MLLWTIVRSLTRNVPHGKTILVTHIELQKMSRRKVERRWCSSGLTVHREIYDFTKKAVTTIAHNAKCAYYSAKIAESSKT